MVGNIVYPLQKRLNTSTKYLSISDLYHIWYSQPAHYLRCQVSDALFAFNQHHLIWFHILLSQLHLSFTIDFLKTNNSLLVNGVKQYPRTGCTGQSLTSPVFPHTAIKYFLDAGGNFPHDSIPPTLYIFLMTASSPSLYIFGRSQFNFIVLFVMTVSCLAPLSVSTSFHNVLSKYLLFRSGTPRLSRVK